MGMAASQARLLSITSRMADNELRSQIINNSKMRLATESSRVSEEYISALNSATMMMSNYDTAGESQYQKLSFNSLTAYSSYNNQYGLVNANGKLLVSESDAANYRKIKEDGGNLDDFLGLYGLEYSSTFFSADTLGGDPVPVTYIDNDGNEILLGEYSVAQLKDMYEGTNGYDKSYNDCFQTSEYVNYTENYTNMLIADENYWAAVNEYVSSNIFDSTWSSNYDKYVNGNGLNTLHIESLYGGFKYLYDKIEGLQGNGMIPQDNQWANEILANIEAITWGYYTSSGGSFGPTYIIDNDSSTSTPNSMPNIITLNGKAERKYQVSVADNGDNTYTIDNDIIIDLNNMNPDDLSSISISNTDDTTEFSYNIKEINGNKITFTYTEQETQDDGTILDLGTQEYVFTIGEDKAEVNVAYTDCDSLQPFLISLYQQFYNNIGANLNKEKFAQTSSTAQSALNEYNNAVNTLVSLVIGPEPTDAADKAEWQKNKELLEANLSIFSDPALIVKFTEENNITISDSFEPIKQISILDCLFDIHGEPAWGWIDVNNPDENADAKVQWYTNLYNRMEQGYAVFEDGLASSNEWIQFALESGLVTMEQVNTENNWTSTIYTNISDITEVTDDAAVTKAEAEYNKAMNNIENKDKRYDMELKNIDTEHNSLQTEYDSVKSVIDKNIERSFKIYS